MIELPGFPFLIPLLLSDTYLSVVDVFELDFGRHVWAWPGVECFGFGKFARGYMAAKGMETYLVDDIWSNVFLCSSSVSGVQATFSMY
jgi:hypothetical protein